MKLKKSKVSEEIPTSSMADVTFLLIITFMLTSTFAASRGLDFALPEDDKNPPIIEKEEAVLVTIRPGGSLDVDGKAMRLEAIFDYLRPKLERNPNKPVIIRPEPETAYGEMVRVYDYLRRGKDDFDLEIRNISIPTQREIDQFWY